MNPVSGVVAEAWAIYRAHARHLLPMAFVVYLATAVVTAVLVAVLGVGGVFLGALVNFVAGMLLQAALVKAVEDVRDGRADLSIPETLAVARLRLWPVIGAAIVAGVAIGVGFFLLIVPGLWLATFLSVTIPVVVLEQRDVVDSLKRSWQLVSGNGWNVFAQLVVTFVIYIVVEIVVGAILVGTDSWIRSAVSSIVAGTLVMPFLVTVLTLLYYRLRGLGGPFTPTGYGASTGAPPVS